MIGSILLWGTAGLALGFILLSVNGLWRWQGRWRWVMAAPLLLLIGVVGNIAIGIAVDPTAHNLWPFEVLMWLVVALVAAGLLYLVRWLSRRVWNRHAPEKVYRQDLHNYTGTTSQPAGGGGDK